MKYRVHSIGKDIEREHGEILCGENTSLEYVGRVSKGKGPTIKMTQKGIETPEMDI